MSIIYKKSFAHALVALCCALLLTGAVAVSAQTEAGDLPEGASQEQVDGALEDLSTLYGSPVVRVDQAKAICNQEQYFLDCAEIGKKYDLFDADRAEQVDTLVAELKGDVANRIAECSTVECLVDVASSVARDLTKSNPSVARAVELTSKNVEEKQAIVDAAKEIGVDFEACRTMDPDTASVDLLRACARLAKDVRVQSRIPEGMRTRSDETDASIDFKESLATGELQCGDGTMDGCGDFCLNPSTEVQAQGTSGIPQVCRDIAQRFFGPEGVRQLEASYSTVQRTKEASRNNESAFTTLDGRTLTSPAEIGRYMEEAGQRGDVEAVKKGMDFMVARGFVRPADRDFAIKMIEKIRDRGAINFDACRTNPEACRDFVPEDHQEEFATMGQVEEIMRTEMTARGVPDMSRCEFDPVIGKSCMEAARAAIPKLRALAVQFPRINMMIENLEQKIRFGDESFAARSRAEERIRSGGFTVGDQQFSTMADLEAFCRTNSQECLAEVTRTGVFSRDVATEKYQYAAERRYEEYRPDERFTPGYEPRPAYEDTGSLATQPSQFDKEAARKAFEAWLDNPQGPPPYLTGPRYQNQPYPMPYPYPGDHTDDGSVYPYPGPACPDVFPRPCPDGEYRQESRDSRGCFVSGACIPIATKTQPKSIDGKVICPAMPTVESCQAGEEKVVSFTSPECGTYYMCERKYTGTQVKYPYTFGSGKITPSYEAARMYCYESGAYGATTRGDVGECGTSFGFSVPPISPEKQCSQYGNGWYPVDSSGNCFSPDKIQYRTPGGTLQQCSSAPVYGCSDKQISTCPAGQYWDGYRCLTSDTFPPMGQKQQIWNSYGLQSWIRDDASATRIASLKTACANVKSSANVWVGDAGSQASSDFGMPDPDKCAKAAACTTDQYFDGTACKAGSGTSGGGQCWTYATESSCKAYSECRWDTAVGGSPCMPAGTTTSPTPQCSDGKDNDSDGKVDYPADPECYAEVDWDEATGGAVIVPSQGKNQIWNNKGLQSMIREDADSARISSLQQACAHVGSSANVWMPNAGDSASKDFGMPDPAKCAATAAPQCSDNKDNDSDGWIDYPNDSGCTGAGDNNEVYEAPTTTTTTNNYPGDANSCPGFAYSRWDSTGKRYCQLNNEARCDYEHPSYLTSGNYSMAKCPGSGTTNTNTTTGSCSSELTNLLGSGCHNMSTAWFNGDMTKYVMPNTTEVKSCATSWVDGCSGGTTTGGCPSYTSQSTCTAAAGACTWSSTGNYCSYSSTTSSCPSGQYWNGSSCANNTTTTSCGTYTTMSTCSANSSCRWDPANYCTTNSGGSSSSMQRCFYPNATKNGAPTGYTVWCESDYYNCHEGSPSGATVSLTNLALGAPSSCESGWTGGSSSTSCPSGQYWNGSSCVNSPVTTCGSNTSQSSCTAASGCSWSSSSNSCYYQSSSSCSSGQYWNGSSCVASSSTSCASGQYWNGSACASSSDACIQAGGTWNSSSNYCQMPNTSSCSSDQYWNGSSCVSNTNTTSTSCPSGQYWNGSSCVNTSTTDCPSGQYWNGSSCVSSTTTTTDYSSAQSGCASAGGTWDSSANYCRMPGAYFCPTGHEWNGSHCTFAQQPTQERMTASVLRAFLSLFGF